MLAVSFEFTVATRGLISSGARGVKKLNRSWFTSCARKYRIH